MPKGLNKRDVEWEEIPLIDEGNREICLNCKENFCNGCTSFPENKEIDVSKKRNHYIHIDKQSLELKMKRKNKDMTLRDLSELTGIPIGTLGGYESGFTVPSEERLKKILEVLEG